MLYAQYFVGVKGTLIAEKKDWKLIENEKSTKNDGK